MNSLNRRTTVVLTAGLAVLALSAVLLYRATSAPDRVPSLSQRSDTSGFQSSDVALIGTTGAPQLLEFFHPE